ncbi:MAG: glycosyltransferase family 39 protein [Acidobacteria bacterium]|nr:glycosyltransferase family 39 protein [Acidobacteriota bacterium]
MTSRKEEKPGKTGAGRWALRPDVRARVVPLVLLNLVALLLIGNFLNSHLKNFGGDDIHFLLLAEALARGAGFVNLHLPGLPIHTHYPPLYPALLAPLLAAGAPLVVLKAWTAVLGMAGFNLAYLFLVPVRGRTLALLAVLGAMLSESFLDVGLHCMSDGPYLLFSFAALLFVRRTFAQPGPWTWNAVLAGAFTGLSVLLRTVGVVFAPAIAIYALVARAPGLALRSRITRLAVVGAVTLAFSTPWLATLALKGGPVSYVVELTNTNQATGAAAEAVPGGMLRRPVANVIVLAKDADSTDMRPVLRPIYLVLFAATTILVIAGLARGIAVRRDVGAIYVVVYVVVMMAWVPSGFRLLMPLFPLLLSALCDGLELLARGTAQARAARTRRVAAAWLAGIMVVELAVMQFAPLVNQRLHGHEAQWWREYLRAVCTLGTIADPGAIVVSQPDVLPYYLTGLQSPPLRGKRPDMRQAILDSGAKYVILSPNLRNRRAFTTAVREAPERFRSIAKIGDIEVFAIVDPATPMDWQPAAVRPYSPRCQQVLTYEAD